MFNVKEITEKYGDTPEFKEFQKKFLSYTENDWCNIMEKGNEIFLRLSEHMDKTVCCGEVQSIIEEWRQHISKYFYNCTIDVFRGLGELYLLDKQYFEVVDKIKSGLSSFLSEAIKVYCDRY